MDKAKQPSSSKGDNSRLTRRQFMATSGAALSFTILNPGLVRGTAANSKIELGLVGCGQRGTWIADLFTKHGGYQVVAAADYFQDRVDASGEKLSVPAEQRYTGLSCYKQLLEGKVDAIAIESPPYFHPEQAAAGVEAGVHVYLAKPIAVDVPGCQSVEESGRKATTKNQCFLVDFQTRTDPLYQEAVARTQNGDIGRIVSGEATYIANIPWAHQIEVLKPDPTNPELQLRAWGLFRALSGDVITEQNIHAIDVASWILDGHPKQAYGTGGQGARSYGDCYDHFSVIFTFPDEILVSFCSKQYGAGWDDILCRMYGTEGTVDTHYFGDVSIQGKKPYPGGKVDDLYPNGAIRNIATFHDSIMKNDFSNPTVAPSVQSNLSTILGRMAAYRSGGVTWDEMMTAGEKFEPNLDGLKA